MIDITHIIRHDFMEVHDLGASMEFINETIRLLKERLFIQVPDDAFPIWHDNEDNETNFSVPVYDVQFVLHNGFWQIESYYHYRQLVMHTGDYFHLRRMTFDIARALGRDEAWYAAEYYTWNGGACEKAESTFGQWYEQAEKDYGKPIPEFNQQAIMALRDEPVTDYEDIYHDSFEDCRIYFDRLQSKIPDYTLLGLYRTPDNRLRCKKDKCLYSIDEHTLAAEPALP